MTSRPRSPVSSPARSSGHCSADRLDHALAPAPAGELPHLLEDAPVVVHHDRLRGAAVARATSSANGRREIAMTRAPACGGELRQQRAEEADADDGDGLPGLDAAAPEDVDGAAERLARHRHAVERRAAAARLIGLGDVVLGVRAVGERGDAVAVAQGRVTPAPDGDDAAPAFVARRARRLRVVEPRAALPDRQAGRADAASLRAAAAPGPGRAPDGGLAAISARPRRLDARPRASISPDGRRGRHAALPSRRDVGGHASARRRRRRASAATARRAPAAHAALLAQPAVEPLDALAADTVGFQPVAC